MATFRGRHIISIKGFSKEDVVHVMGHAGAMHENRPRDLPAGKVVASLLHNAAEIPAMVVHKG